MGRKQEPPFASVCQDQLDAKPADVDDLGGPLEIGIACLVFRIEARSPLDVDVVVARPSRVGVGADQDQCLVEQMLYDQAGRVARRIHDADIQRPLDQASHQVLLEADFAADRDVGGRVAHPANPRW
jgi:hypothetical protein